MTLLLLATLTLTDEPPAVMLDEPPAVRRCGPACGCADCRCPFAGACVYGAARRLSERDGRPLVVFVGRPVRDVPGCRCVGTPEFPDVTGAAVVVGRPAGGNLGRTDLPAAAGDAAIRQAAFPPVVPFFAAPACPTCRPRP